MSRMMQRVRALTAGLLGLAFVATPALAQDFKGDGWTHTYKANCGAPVSSANDPQGRPRSIAWVNVQGDTQLVMRLNPGDIGGCASDKRSGNGARYWERAEVRQTDTLSPGLNYRIQFSALFAEGFTGADEHFFQVAGWGSNCRSSPLIKLMFNKGRMEAKVLKPGGTTFGKVTPVTVAGFGRTLRRLRGQSHDFVVDLDLRGPSQKVSVAMNGRVLVREQELFAASCVRPYVKVGLFRPGGPVNRSKTTLVVDDVSIYRLR